MTTDLTLVWLGMLAVSVLFGMISAFNSRRSSEDDPAAFLSGMFACCSVFGVVIELLGRLAR